MVIVHISKRYPPFRGRVARWATATAPGILDEQKRQSLDLGEQAPASVGQGPGPYLVDTLVDRYGGEVRVGDSGPRGTVVALDLRRS